MRGWGKLALCGVIAAATLHGSAWANNVGENVAWQFQSTADRANRAILEDLRQKRASGYYSAPVYNTTIERQYNCSVSAAATGSSASSTAIGNSPSTTGNSSNATGNSAQTSVNQGNPADSLSSSIFDRQYNTGSVRSGAIGNVSARVSGDTSQVLNTSQTNSGNQSSNVTGSNACQFGPLN